MKNILRKTIVFGLLILIFLSFYTKGYKDGGRTYTTMDYIFRTYAKYKSYQKNNSPLSIVEKLEIYSAINFYIAHKKSNYLNKMVFLWLEGQKDIIESRYIADIIEIINEIGDINCLDTNTLEAFVFFDETCEEYKMKFRKNITFLQKSII